MPTGVPYGVTMTSHQRPLIQLVSAVNETALAHEDQQQTTTHAYDDVAHTALALASFIRYNWQALAADLDENARKEVLKATLRASDAANEYLKASVTHVRLGLDLLEAANSAVAAVMNHDQLIGA